jgi:hypothetical protein
MTKGGFTAGPGSTTPRSPLMNPTFGLEIGPKQNIGFLKPGELFLKWGTQKFGRKLIAH